MQIYNRYEEKNTANWKSIYSQNIGQYKGSGGEKIFDNINQFIYRKDIVELSKYIPDDLLARINSYLKDL